MIKIYAKIVEITFLKCSTLSSDNNAFAFDIGTKQPGEDSGIRFFLPESVCKTQPV